MKILYITLIGSFLVLHTDVFAENTNESSISTTVTTAFASQYFFRGVRLGGETFEPSVEVDGSAYKVGLLSYQPLANKVVGQSDPEIDLYGSYTLSYSNGISVSPGFTLYVYPNANNNNGFYTATVEPNLAISYTFKGITFTPEVYYDIVMQGPTFELNVAYTVPLTSLHTELDFTGNFGYYDWNDSLSNTHPSVSNYGTYYQVGVTLPFSITDKWSFNVGASYTDNIGNYFNSNGIETHNDAAVGRGIVTAAFSYKF